MLLDVVLGRFIAVADSLLRVAMCDERLMRRMRIVFLGVVLRCAAMMQRRLLMLLRCRGVMFGAGENPRHDLSKFALSPKALCKAVAIYSGGAILTTTRPSRFPCQIQRFRGGPYAYRL